MKSAVIFTDLDGTLLDHETYTFEPALQALRLIRESGVPLVICSSKTRGEIERYRQRLGNRHPFISENGGGIFIPTGYFDPVPLPAAVSGDSSGGYAVIRLGAAYADLRRAMAELGSEGFAIKGFGDMTASEVAAITGLSGEEAALAMEREFDEPFIFEGDDESAGRLQMAVREKGFHLTVGRFFHILGESDKGKAFDILAALYRQKLGAISTIALGDSPNDIPMLERADFPVLVKKPGGEYDRRIDVPRLVRADGIGPTGWNTAILGLLGGPGAERADAR
jgi:mannosyl-3-phosphoglycerate phosphatase family protein